MLAFNINHNYPTFISKQKLNIITTKKSLFGIHTLLNKSDYDKSCTKTSIISFINNTDAIDFKTNLEQFQKLNRKFVDRVIDNSPSENRMQGVNLTLGIDTLYGYELEQLCNIHWFSLIVVHRVDNNYEYLGPIDTSSYANAILDCTFNSYLYEATQPAQNTKLLYLEQMLKKK